MVETISVENKTSEDVQIIVTLDSSVNNREMEPDKSVVTEGSRKQNLFAQPRSLCFISRVQSCFENFQLEGNLKRAIVLIKKDLSL